MAHMKITPEQARALFSARSMSYAGRKTEKRSIMAAIHRQYPSIGRRKIALFIENPDNPLYCVIRDKRTKLPLDDGKPTPVEAVAAPAPAAKPAAKPAVKTAAKPAVKTVAKPAVKTVAKPAVKTVAKPVAKPAVKTVAKPAVKTVAKPAVKTAVKTAAKPAVKTAIKTVAKPAVKPAAKTMAPVQGEAFEVRFSHGGKRTYLGKATSEAQKAKMIAKFKKENGIK